MKIHTRKFIAMRRFVLTCSLLCLSLDVSSRLAAQSSPAQSQANAGSTVPVIRAETRLVLVDVIVTDKKGNYLHDLAAKDFRLWEDNSEQPIKTFSFASTPADTQDPRQYLVLLFDNSSFVRVDPKQMREAAAKFVEANAGPNHYIALLDFAGTLSVAQDFTTDAARLKQAVLNDRAASVAATHTPMQVAPRSGPRNTSLMQQGDLSSRNLLLAIRGVARRLSTMPGRKSIILLSPGFSVTPRELPAVMAATDACNKANVAIYPVVLREMTSGVSAESYVPGKYGEGGTFSPRGRGSRDTTPMPTLAPTSTDRVLDSLAQDTGGFVILKINSLFGEMEKVAKEQSEYYVLGYTPAASPEGTCHTLRVKVERGGTDVRARSGYCNVKPADPLAGKPIEKQLEAQASGDSPGNIAASMQAPYFYASPNVARVELALEIPPGAINFVKQKGKFAASLDILGLAYKADGTVAARFSDSVPLEFEKPKDVEDFRKNPLHYNHEFEAAPGSYTLRVAFATSKESFARLEAPLVIDPYDGKQIAISGVALSKEIYPAPSEEDLLGASLVEDRTLLVSRGFEFVPSGSDHFKKGAPGAFYVEVYDPLLLAANPSQVLIHVKVTDTRTGAAKLDVSGPVPDLKPGKTTVPLGLKIPVETLSPGTYRLEVGASDSAGSATTLRTTAFVVD